MDSFEKRKERIAVSLQEKTADLVMKQATYLNVFTKQWKRGDIAVSHGYIAGIGSFHGKKEIDASNLTIVPGFIDGHLHLESAVVTPKQYAKAVLPHGTTSIVTDPHEITNVCGTTGMDYILETTKKLPLDVYVMVPSCVPSTCFDETGAEITYKMVRKYMSNERVLGLAELMNYPGVLAKDTEVLKKIQVTMKREKLIDGHAPALTKQALTGYITAGVTSDHECTNAEEAIEKLENGQWIMIREGTACKNLEKLLPLLEEPYCNRCLLVTDDKHPGELKQEGHIDHMIRKAISLGAKPQNVYTAASWQAAARFRLQFLGAIAPGYRADFVVLEEVDTVKIHSVYKNGIQVSDHKELVSGKELHSLNRKPSKKETQLLSQIMNSVHAKEISLQDLDTKHKMKKVIGLVAGEILTLDLGETDRIDLEKDNLKLVVVERHKKTGHIGVCYVHGYGMKKGAVATSIAHDAHNLIAVGTNDEDILCALERIQKLQGGMVVVNEQKVVEELALPIAGLMCDFEVEKAQEKMDAVKKAASQLGVNAGIDPFMTLSFTSLPVIPKLRLTTKGVVDVESFQLI